MALTGATGFVAGRLVKKLLDEGTIDTFAYPDFVQKQFGFTSIEFAVEFCQALRADAGKCKALADEIPGIRANIMKHPALVRKTVDRRIIGFQHDETIKLNLFECAKH